MHDERTDVGDPREDDTPRWEDPDTETLPFDPDMTLGGHDNPQPPADGYYDDPRDASSWLRRRNNPRPASNRLDPQTEYPNGTPQEWWERSLRHPDSDFFPDTD